MSDNLLLLVAERTEGRPGKLISLDPSTDVSIAAFIGAVDTQDVLWAIRNVHEQQWAAGQGSPEQFLSGWLTASGWERVEELKRAHISSRYALLCTSLQETASIKANSLGSGGSSIKTLPLSPIATG